MILKSSVSDGQSPASDDATPDPQAQLLNAPRPLAVSRLSVLTRSARPYGFVAGLAALTTAIYLRPWTYPSNYVFSNGVDALWQQAIFQMHADTGIFGSTPHLAWPVGADPWRLPQLGALVGAWAKVSVGWLHLGTASAVMWCLVLTAGANAAAVLFLLRSVARDSFRVLSYAAALSFGISVFVVGHQINLSSLYPIPIVLGLLLRAPNKGRRELKRPAVVAGVVAFLSPMWWIVVMVLMLPFMALAPLIRRLWASLRDLAVIGGAVVAGLSLQAMIFVIAASAGPGADTGREAWTSNYFPGNTVSLMIGSPLLRKWFPGLMERLTPGASGVPSLLGVPFILMAALALVLVVAIPPREHERDRRLLVLSSATIVATLYWLGGGLGNFQAAVAVIAGTVSPARVWYRMAVVMAIVGVAWLLLALQIGRQRARRGRAYTIGSFVLAALLVASAIGDLLTYDRQYSYPKYAEYWQPAHEVAAFLNTSVAACPVAQFPNEGIPVSRIPPTGMIDPLIYTGLVPYVVEPSFYWSAGAYDPKNPTGLAAMPQALDDASMERLRDLGYCAVLFDKAQSASAVAQNIAIEGRDLLLWRTPDFANERYALYLLK